MKAHQDLRDFGNRILTEARTELYLAMRFMGRALDSLSYTLDLSTQRMGTDARTIHYNPTFVFHLFVESPQKLDRLYLHNDCSHAFHTSRKSTRRDGAFCTYEVSFPICSLRIFASSGIEKSFLNVLSNMGRSA